MNSFIETMKNFGETENGAVAYNSTQSALLDAFGSLGAMKDSSEEDIINIFSKAYDENPDYAMKLLFYMRDIREGQGMRRVFRICCHWLAYTHRDALCRNLQYISEYGRWDDLINLFYNQPDVRDEAGKIILNQLNADIIAARDGGNVSLLGKWMPSNNASSKTTKNMARMLTTYLHMTPKLYRKTLAYLRKYIDVVECKMSDNSWDKINYSTVPSHAANNYANAFAKHDIDRYQEYLMNLAIGKATINANALFPKDILHKVWNYSSNRNVTNMIADAQWKALPNYFGDSIETGICVVDTSGSMWGDPLEVAVSLGLYCADKCRGPFKNHFITFSSCPSLQKIRGATFAEKVNNMKYSKWGMNTDIEKVFDLILMTAKNSRCKPEDMPKKLYIISDMQFDEARTNYDYYSNKSTYKAPFMQQMKQKFKDAGYEMPALIYWNVRASHCAMFHDTFDGEDCCFVSGYSPVLFKNVLEGTEYVEVTKADGTKEVKQKIDPMNVMMTTLNSERYAPIMAY